MKEMLIESASMLHNWRQRIGINRDKASRNDKSIGSARRRVETLLAGAINMANYRSLAHRAGMNSADLIDLLVEKLPTIGPKGLAAAFQRHQDHGIVTCLQYLNSL